jgi:hypothetical protein
VIRVHADVVEGDLAFRGIDLRDLYRRGSGMTPRRLWVLIRALPEEALTWRAIHAETIQAQKPTIDLIRERAAHYAG